MKVIENLIGLYVCSWGNRGADGGDKKKSNGEIFGESEFLSGKNYFQKENYTKSFIHFGNAASKDIVEAFYYLGEHYHRGFGVKKSFERAFKYYEKASYLGHAVSMERVGLAYHYGKGVLKDNKQAEDWLRKSIDAGNNGTLYKLAMFYYDKKDYEKAINLLKKSAKKGNKIATYMLGNIYHYGIGELKDHKQALKYYEIVAKSDLVSQKIKSLYKIANLYLNGEGINLSHKKAKNYLKLLLEDKIFVEIEDHKEILEKAKKLWDRKEMWKF